MVSGVSSSTAVSAWIRHGTLVAGLALCGCGRRAPAVLAIRDVYVPAPAAGGPGALYATIVNGTTLPDTLLGLATAAADSAGLHEPMAMGAMAHMQPVRAIPIAAGGTLRLRPGGYHGMLGGLRRVLAPGDTFAVTFRFARAGARAATAAVITYADLDSRLRSR